MDDRQLENINTLSSDAVKYILSQPRDSDEAIEMQWYLRWMRDALFYLWVCSETRVYDDLIKATYYITSHK